MTIKHLYPTQSPALDLNFARTRRLDPRITFTRTSTATYFDSQGVLQTAASGEPRFDHDPVTGESLGLLIEESRTNSVTNSEDLTGWSGLALGDGVTPTAQSIVSANPSGGYTVTEITLERSTANTSNYSIYRKQFGTTAVSTGSIYLKAARPQDVGKVVDLYHNQGAPQDFVSVTLTDSWQRVSSVGLGGTVGYLSVALFQATASVGEVKVLAWGAQVEEGDFPTSYIPTSGSTLTRSADVASMTGTNFSDWYNQSEGAWFVNGSRIDNATDTNVIVVSVDDDTNDNRQMLNIRDQYQYYIETSNVVQAQIDAGSILSGFNLIAGAYKTNDITCCLNSVIATDTTATIPTVDRLRIFAQRGGIEYSGHISRLAYYPVRLPDENLQALTS